MINWGELLGAMVIPEEGLAPLIVSPAQLDAFEDRAVFRLPASYRGYAQTIGPGLVDIYEMAVPWSPSRGDLGQHDIDQLNRLLHGVMPGSWPDDEPDRDRVSRLVFFASDIANSFYGWDPTVVTEPEMHEYAIYAKDHGSYHLKRVASTFEEFVMNFCLGRKLKHQGGGADSGGEAGPNTFPSDRDSRITFVPHYLDEDDIED